MTALGRAEGGNAVFLRSQGYSATFRSVWAMTVAAPIADIGRWAFVSTRLSPTTRHPTDNFTTMFSDVK